MQIRDKFEQRCKWHSQQQAHHTPQPAPEENTNRRRHRPDTHASGNKLWNQKVRGQDTQKEDSQSDDVLN